MFRFLCDVVVGGVPYKAGDVVPAVEIPAGSHECLLNLRFAELHKPEPTQSAPESESQKQAAKKAAKAAVVPSE